MMRVFLAITLALAACCFSATGATINVDTMSRDDMVAAIAAASAGDTLVFPSGSADYASAVTLNKAITLQFQEGTSIINNTSGGENTWVIIVDGSPTPNTDAIRITGLHINGVSSGGANAQGSGILVGTDQRNVRIDHCTFANMRRHAIQFIGVGGGGDAYGLVDRCRFTNCYTAIEVNGDDNVSWAAPATGIATTNAVVVEDCYFEQNDDSLVTDLNNTIYISNGGRIIMRKFTVRGIGTEQNMVFWDSHGNNSQEPWDANSLRGTVFALIYDGTIDVDSSYRHFYLRGGMHLLANITITSPSGAAPISLTEEEAWHWAFTTDSTWPASDQLTNTWIANVTFNGVAVDNTSIQNFFGDSNAADPELEDADEEFLQLNRDYFIVATTNSIPAFDSDGHPTISGGSYGVDWLPYPHQRVTADAGGGGGGGGSSGASDVNVTELRVGTIEVAP